VHARFVVAGFEDGGFGLSEFDQAGFDFLLRLKLLREANVSAVMARFRFEEAAKKMGQSLIFKTVAEEAKSLAGTSFDQAGDEETIDRLIRLVFADEFAQLAPVGAGGKLAKLDAALLEDFANHVEVFEFLANDFGHFLTQVLVFDIGEEQIHRRAGRLFLAVSVVDQEQVESVLDARKPARRRGFCEVEHGKELRMAGGFWLLFRKPAAKRKGRLQKEARYPLERDDPTAYDNRPKILLYWAPRMKKLRNHHRKNRGKHIRRQTEPGAVPGSVVVDPAARQPDINVMLLSSGQFQEHRKVKLEELSGYLADAAMAWVEVDGLGDARLIERLGELFHLHRLALEDVVNSHQRAKVESYGDYLFLVARMPKYDSPHLADRCGTEQLSMFLKPGLLITFQEKDDDCLEPVRVRLRQGTGRIREQGVDHLAYALIDAAIDAFYPILEKVGERIEELEEVILVKRSPMDAFTAIREVKRELLVLRRAIWPHREMIGSLIRDPFSQISDATRVYLRDCYDHAVQIIDLLELYRDLSSDLRDFHLSMVSHRMNEQMRVLTVVATLFMPPTFLVGLYGQNFAKLPFADEKYGYWPFYTALVIFALSSSAMMGYFWYVGWIGRRRRE
jgi:magnesium transporter